jgi:hypothetical protein
MGLTYVSCSPFRVPIARLAAAHAALRQWGHDNKKAVGSLLPPAFFSCAFSERKGLLTFAARKWAKSRSG